MIKPIDQHSVAGRPARRRARFLVAVATAALALMAIGGAMAAASAPSGVVPTILARGTFEPFKVLSYPEAGGLFKAEAKAPIDMVVRRHEYAVGATTGWHAHPYPVFITVISGTVTFYSSGDPTCTPIVVSAGQGYVDSGKGHIGRNESGAPAVDVSVIMAPVGAAFRAELPAPNPNCGF
ncbi:MAG: cupin domain-containing protein [Chloroflexota bacterium]